MKNTERRIEKLMLDIERGLNDLSGKKQPNEKFRPEYELCLQDLYNVRVLTNRERTEVLRFCTSDLSKWRGDAYRDYYTKLPKAPEEGDGDDVKKQYAEAVRNNQNPNLTSITGDHQEAEKEFSDAIKMIIEDPDFIKLLPSEYSKVKKLRDRINEMLNISNKWDGLNSGLVDMKYIENVPYDDFREVMERHLPKGDRIKWMGTKASAVYFCKEFGFSLPEFNKCFKSKSGADFRHNDYNGNLATKDGYIDFLEGYKISITKE